MRSHRFFILIGAAAAGWLVYKAQHTLTAPGTGSAPGQNIYSNVTGDGSLMHTIRNSTAERDAAMSGDANARQNRRQPSYGAPAETSQPDDLGLIQAASKGDKSTVEHKLADHVKVDSRDSQRRTPLMYACWNGYDDISNRLLAAGANPEFQDRAGHNAFDYAAGRGMLGSINFLLQRTHTQDEQHYVEYAALIKAVFAADATQLPEGKGKLASVNRLNPEDVAPLHIAAGNGSIPLIDALIQRGATVNIVNSNRQTPLHWAAWNDRAEAADFLLKKGADLTLTDLAGNTALMMAAQSNSKDVAKLLLTNGADRYAANKEGKTASIIAEDNGFTELAAILK